MHCICGGGPFGQSVAALPENRQGSLCILPTARKNCYRRDVGNLRARLPGWGCRARQTVSIRDACCEPRAVMSGKPSDCRAAENSCDTSRDTRNSSSFTDLEIPSSSLKAAAMAAPDNGRSAAATKMVLNAEAAARKRKAARSNRDRVSRSRAGSLAKADSAAEVAQSDGRAVIAPGDDRSAAVRESGDTAAQVNRFAVAHNNGRCAVARECNHLVVAHGVDCSPVPLRAAVAGPDDVHGETAAGTASMDEGRADRATYAGVALSRKKNKHMKKRKGKSTEPNPRNLPLERGALEVPTDPAALMDGPSHVKCVARQVDWWRSARGCCFRPTRKLLKRSWIGCAS